MRSFCLLILLVSLWGTVEAHADEFDDYVNCLNECDIECQLQYEKCLNAKEGKAKCGLGLARCQSQSREYCDKFASASFFSIPSEKYKNRKKREESSSLQQLALSSLRVYQLMLADDKIIEALETAMRLGKSEISIHSHGAVIQCNTSKVGPFLCTIKLEIYKKMKPLPKHLSKKKDRSN